MHHCLCIRRVDKVAKNWSAFEREFAGLRDGYEAVKSYVDSFEVFVNFHKKNLERAEVVVHNRRASKKLINWVADYSNAYHRSPFVDGWKVQCKY